MNEKLEQKKAHIQETINNIQSKIDRLNLILAVHQDQLKRLNEKMERNSSSSNGET